MSIRQCVLCILRVPEAHRALSLGFDAMQTGSISSVGSPRQLVHIIIPARDLYNDCQNNVAAAKRQELLVGMSWRGNQSERARALGTKSATWAKAEVAGPPSALATLRRGPCFCKLVGCIAARSRFAEEVGERTTDGASSCSLSVSDIAKLARFRKTAQRLQQPVQIVKQSSCRLLQCCTACPAPVKCNPGPDGSPVLSSAASDHVIGICLHEALDS